MSEVSHDDIFNSRYGPRAARGGIKSQTARGKFGKNWWAQRWLRVLESLDLGGRLARGRVYARRGQVLSIDIKAGAIEARVQGSRFQPYDLKIEVTTIPLEKWILLSETAFNQAIVAAKLLAGEMPQDIEKLFAEHQLSLFPKSMDDLKTECSCPDYSNPCKHIASVYYLLGEEFDRDPFLIFLMRGLSKEQLIDLITKTGEPIKISRVKTRPGSVSKKSSSKLGASSAKSGKSQSSTVSKVAEKPTPLPLEDFWTVQPCSHLVGSISAPAVNASLPNRLGNFPFWRSNYPFIPTLEQIYKTASESAIADLANEKFNAGDRS
ncbi:MAG: SWIM zinc finger family protein [Cyanobacteria bacterium SZAS-4]|nr:SWIM zinc finger family protein [Cyanobacteria bacterium SZAS-4]